jgi:hypothetical protein
MRGVEQDFVFILTGNQHLVYTRVCQGFIKTRKFKWVLSVAGYSWLATPKKSGSEASTS